MQFGLSLQSPTMPFYRKIQDLSFKNQGSGLSEIINFLPFPLSSLPLLV